ncbi:Carbohydrate family 9 binding domain-like [Lutibacter oricola]|uniref:Carbohydrate family 9 binding domain-like n=1 Tax=Lutibacter oricola TaxID=762486 RepID=A0A1H3F803_9FLAO|nr:carbohydrate-binding family 9-like protein [Lutibacter oricola]SDX86324.1 Carbohydrate family 9 binding domain-like [Lutibacter oricola]
MKNSINQLTLLIIAFSLLVSCNNKKETVKEDISLFKATNTKALITVDGIMNEKDWKKAPVYTFDYFYENEKKTDVQKTSYRMLWDDKNMYLFFQCEDQFINARETVRDGAPFLDDCAEIFLAPVPETISTHFCFEVNVLKTPNDIVYLDNFYNNTKGVVKAFSPDYEIGVQINGTLNDNTDIDKGWTMEYAIPLNTFRGVDTFHPIAEGTKWRFLALRQDRNEVDGERRITSTIVPVFDQKRVHEAGLFGMLEFSK